MKMLMLDSGAFTVWTKKIPINLERYIQFCKGHPFISYYVNLDVIPGQSNKKSSLTPQTINQAAQQGWDNYEKMLEKLPKEKVIPVFHQHEDFKWLEKYLEFGTPYLGISPDNDRTTTQKIEWLRKIKNDTSLCDKNGDPKIKVHGFAVTSLRLMKFWHWHSVDSKTWLMDAALGSILVPKSIEQKYDYAQKPQLMSFSDRSPNKNKRNFHFDLASPPVRKEIENYIDCVLLQYNINAEKLRKYYKQRSRANIQFMNRQEEVLQAKQKVDHIYFAGSYNRYSKYMHNRLFSYFEIMNGKNEGLYKILQKYEHKVKDETNTYAAIQHSTNSKDTLTYTCYE